MISKIKLLVSLSAVFTLLISCKTEVYSKNSIKSINGKNITVSELDDFLKKQMDSLGIPALSFAYINDNRVVYTKNFGVENTETKESVTDKTLFDAASISKTVFSFFVMQQVDNGLLTLDTPLYKYWENPDIEHDERYKKITARMALSHTTGFPNWRYLTSKGYDPNGKLRIEFEPGTQYQYSGEGYKYLAQTVAHLLKTDMNGLQEFIKRETFDPLGMGESSFIWNDYLENHRADGHIKGKPNKGYSINSKDPDFNAAASLQTNALAYGNFLSALMSGKLLSKNSQKEMLRVQVERKTTNRKPGVKYGLGIIVNETLNGINYAHSGDNGSTTSQFFFNNKYKSGYVFFTNMETRRKNLFENNLKTFLSMKKEN